MIDITYDGSSVFFATPNLSRIKLSLRRIDYKCDKSFPTITKIHPTIYEAGSSYWDNQPLGVINFAKKARDAVIFGLFLIEGAKGDTSFRTKEVLYAGEPTNFIGGGAFLCLRLQNVKNSIYLCPGLVYGEKVSKDLLGFTFGVIPTELFPSNGYLGLQNTWHTSEKCICDMTTVIQSGCKCGGN